MSEEAFIVLDVKSRERAGALQAHGLDDVSICDTLFITQAQLDFAKTTIEYQSKLREKLAEKADAAIDLTTGWDTLESNSVAKIIDVMDNSFDPDYALRVAAISNRATRRLGSRGARTIDPSKVGQIVHITLNQRFIDRHNGRSPSQPSDPHTHETIDVTPTVQKPLMKKVNLPTPQMVTDLLAPARPVLARIKEHKAEQLMDKLGFGSFDEDDKK